MGGRILAMGGGTAGGPAEDYLLSLSGENRPRVCFLSTPSAHRPEYVEVFYDAFRHRRCAPYHVELFGVPDAPAERVAEADIVYVSGGNTANALALWRLHQVDAALREVWGRNGVLGGWSAGAICWFENGITDSFGARLAPLNDGLGLLSGSFCPHYDGDEERRQAFLQAVRDGVVPPGFAADEDAAVLFDGSTCEAVAQREGASAYRVTSEGEEPLQMRSL
jgi:peptidase E